MACHRKKVASINALFSGASDREKSAARAASGVGAVALNVVRPDGCSDEIPNAPARVGRLASFQETLIVLTPNGPRERKATYKAGRPARVRDVWDRMEAARRSSRTGPLFTPFQIDAARSYAQLYERVHSDGFGPPSTCEIDARSAAFSMSGSECKATAGRQTKRGRSHLCEVQHDQRPLPIAESDQDTFGKAVHRQADVFADPSKPSDRTT